MICPTCHAEGRSQLVEGFLSLGTESTCMGWRPFIDKHGLTHSHDPNNHKACYRCGNGHVFFIHSKAPCPNCSYPNEVTP